MKNKPQARFTNILTQETGKELLVYDLEVNKVFWLNETSAIIWLECDGKKSLAEINHSVKTKLKTEFNDELVWLTFEQFAETNLIETPTVFAAGFNNLSRREVTKKLGYASLVTIPFITTLIAPKSTNAQSSGCPVGEVVSGGTCMPVCGTDPCTTPPPGTGTDSACISYQSPGTCSPSGAPPYYTCAYSPPINNCAANGTVCVNGTCR